MNFTHDLGDGARLVLLEERHAPELFALVEANRARLREWLPWLDHNRSVDDTLDFIRKSLQQFANNKGFQTALQVESRLAGVIGFHDIDWDNRKVEIGYWIGLEYQGSGLITGACRALLDHAFHDLGLNRVEIRCASGNARSIAVPVRLGFFREGVARQAGFLYDHYEDWIIFSMLAADWP